MNVYLKTPGLCIRWSASGEGGDSDRLPKLPPERQRPRKPKGLGFLSQIPCRGKRTVNSLAWFVRVRAYNTGLGCSQTAPSSVSAPPQTSL